MKKLFLLLACLLLPATSWAFPDNAVLDTFTGTDGTALPTYSANWATGWLAPGTGVARIEGNGMTTATTNANGNAYWNASTFGAPCEAYATIVTVASGSTYQLACRLQNIGASTTDGYLANFIYPSTLNIDRLDNGVAVPIALGTLGTAISRTIAAGDSIGIRVVGDNICAWHKPAAGSWAVVNCRVDSTYPLGGKIGIGTKGNNTIANLDNFGGGTITPLCSGASPTWTAASVDQLAVNDCMGLSITGDTVNIPAGTATWVQPNVTGSQGYSTVSVAKSITLHGETSCTGSPTTCVDGTIIVDGTGKLTGAVPLGISGTNARVTGISIQDPRSTDVFPVGDWDSGPEVSMTCANCRFDHNSIIDTVSAGAGNSAAGPKTHGVYAVSHPSYSVLIDHNYFKDLNGGTDPHGVLSTEGNTIPNLWGNYSWSQPLAEGSANAVYMEDNNYDYTAGIVADGAYDAYNGARLVFRYNTVKSTNMGGHGVDTGVRSTMVQEIYRNNITNLGAAVYTPIQTRGGWHAIWQNVVPSTGGSYNTFMWITNYRSDSIACSVCGTLCNGSANADQNSGGGEGYACRDQVGRDYQTNTSTDYPYTNTVDSPSHFSEGLAPAYSWGNLFKGAAPTLPANFQGNYTVVSGGSGGGWTRMQTKHVVENRDFYIESTIVDAGTPQTVGVRQGTLAQRPASCTTGVAYFATDQGSWNSSSSDAAFIPSGVAGEDGLLYKCTATNTWTLYYTPYTYPHPLQAATVTAPTGLRLMTQASANSVCLIWTASDMADLAGYRIYHGLASGTYDPAVSIPLNSVNTRHMPDTQYCYSSPKGGTHYFSMTAYNSDIVESTLATEVSTTFTALSRTTASARGGSSARDPLQ